MDRTWNSVSVRERQHDTTAILVAIIVVAITLRIASALLQGNAVEALPGVQDQVSYDALARQVLAGHGFSFSQNWWPMTRAGEPTAHWSFLYTLYLAAVYAVVGPEPLVARLIQAVMAGVLFPWFAWRIGRRLFGNTVALVAAAVSAVYVYFFYYAAALMTESFYIIGILWTLDVAMRIASSARARARNWQLWIELGLALGLTVLLRQLFMLFIPFLALWLLWVARRRRSQGFSLGSMLRGLAASLAVAFALVVPWTVRNYLAFHQFVPLNTNSGYAFFWANHPIQGTNFISILPEDGPTYGDLIPPELRNLNEAALDQALLRRGLGFVADDPLRYALLSISRVKDYFEFWPSSQSGTVSNVARVASFGIFLPFMIYGLLVSKSMARSRDLSNKEPSLAAADGLVLLLLFAAVYTGIHLLSWALIRYRLPVDAVLVIFAAAGIVHAAGWLSASYRKRVMTDG